MKSLLTIMLSCLSAVTAFGQHTQTHKVSFSNIDGFSGYVSFTTVRQGFVTVLTAKKGTFTLALTDYEASREELAVLDNAGISFSAFSPYYPKKFEIVVEGRAYVTSVNRFYAKESNHLQLNDNSGDYTTPEFDENIKKWVNDWQHKHKNKSYWEHYGGFEAEKVTRLLLIDLKAKMKKILNLHKDKKERFATLIAQARSAALKYDFSTADSLLAKASALSGDTSDMNETVYKTKTFINDKKEEKEKKDKEEKEKHEKATKELNDLLSKAQSALWKGDLETAKPLLEKAYKMDPKNQTMIALSKKYAELREEKDNKALDEKMAKGKAEQEKKESKSKKQSVYVIKSNRQLYNELKAMTDAHPGMLNDPKIRARLRGYKAMADMDDRNNRDYQSFKMITGGGYHPSSAKFIASTYKTNANIANAEMAVGAVTDAATNLVNSIIAERERKQNERNARYKQQEANALAKKKAIQKWESTIREKRKVFEKEAVNKIKKNFKLVATIPDLPITYESQKYIAGGNYFKGNRMFFTAPKFEPITKTMQGWGKAKTYNLYIAELDGLYGIFGDNGEVLYPPQFGGIYVLQDVHERPRFLVNIEDKWGEVLAGGKITEEVKYDGIWYTPDRKNKLLKYGDRWTVKAIESGRVLRQFSSGQVGDLYAGGLIPVYHILRKGYIDKEGSYSLGADGRAYAWGESTEEGVSAIPYESARRGQFLERLFRIDGKWFITANYGTNTMTMVAMPPKFVIEVLRETQNGKKWGAINQDGEIVVPFEHKYIRRTPTGFITDKGNYNISK